MDEPRTTLRRSNPLPIILVVVAAVIAIAFFARRFWERSRAPEAPVASAPTSAPAPETPAQPEANVDPATAESLVAAVSQHELYRRAVAEGDLVRRVAVVIDNLREGVSPRRELAFLAPAKPFTVVRRGEETFIDPASHARYDAFGDAVASVDAVRLARAYRAIRGPLEAAYRALGYPGGAIDAALARGLRRIEAVPVLEGEVAVEDEDGIFVFRDDGLERLREVEKHVLRTGPRNTRILQAKARELRAALGLPEPDAARERAP